MLNNCITWISVTDRLPEEGKYVLIWCGEFQIARIEKGISEQERLQMKQGILSDPLEYGWSSSSGLKSYKRSDVYKSCDVSGNNLVPYRWYANGGPMNWKGQDVSHWAYLPDSPVSD